MYYRCGKRLSARKGKFEGLTIPGQYHLIKRSENLNSKKRVSNPPPSFFLFFFLAKTVQVDTNKNLSPRKNDRVT